MVVPAFNMAAIAALTLIAASLAGCSAAGLNPEETSARFVTAPGKYRLYNCQQLAEKTAATVTRQRELRALMAKAETGPDGRVASAIGYRPEYVGTVGDMEELQVTSAEKKCEPVPAPAPAKPAATGAGR